MSEQIILEQEEYNNLLNFMKAPIRKEETGRSIVIEDICHIPMTITMVRGQMEKHAEPEIIGTVFYGRDPYVITRKEDRKDSYVIYVHYRNDRDAFEFVPVKDVRSYKIMMAYDKIKMGLVNLAGSTYIPDDVEGLFSLVKEMEKDDTESR